MNNHQIMDRAKESLDAAQVNVQRAAYKVEDTTAQIPSNTFLVAAFGSIAAALLLQAAGKKESANFIGHWAPTLIALALYNKILRAQRDLEH